MRKGPHVHLNSENHIVIDIDIVKLPLPLRDLFPSLDFSRNSLCLPLPFSTI